MKTDELKKVCDVLNPENESGRLMLIHRFGVEKIGEHLPRLIQAIKSSGQNVVWCSDPMHGNTFSTSEGIKTRHVDQIQKELLSGFEIHRAEGSVLAAAHLELTGDNVTECVGGARDLKESDLSRAYKSQVDPRLNYEQAMEMSFMIAEQIQKQ